MSKVLITAKEVDNIIPDGLKKLGYEVNHLPEPSEADLLEIIADYEGIIITTYTKLNQKVLDQATNLKFIGRVGSGLENIDLGYAKQKGIEVMSSPEGNANAVGEHALGLLLNVMNKISRANQEVKNGIWQREENRGEELDGKTVGIIGLGHTGSAFARKLRGFDVKVLAYDKFKTQLWFGLDSRSFARRIIRKI
jgi:D-3-phosphoglycerate dehydrogenase